MRRARKQAGVSAAAFMAGFSSPARVAPARAFLVAAVADAPLCENCGERAVLTTLRDGRTMYGHSCPSAEQLRVRVETAIAAYRETATSPAAAAEVERDEATAQTSQTLVALGEVQTAREALAGALGELVAACAHVDYERSQRLQAALRVAREVLSDKHSTDDEDDLANELEPSL